VRFRRRPGSMLRCRGPRCWNRSCGNVGRGGSRRALYSSREASRSSSISKFVNTW
jgi:hypothetical protein